VDTPLLRKLGDKKILVRFGDEEDTITGIGAIRISLLIRQERVHVLELSGDLEVLQNFKSAVSYQEASELASEGHASYGMPGRDFPSSESLKSLKICKDRLAELRDDIQTAETDVERQELEQEHAKIREHVRKLTKVDDKSQLERARQRVDRDFREQARKLAKTMPRFAQHLRGSKKYDELTDKYVYDPRKKPP